MNASQIAGAVLCVTASSIAFATRKRFEFSQPFYVPKSAGLHKDHSGLAKKILFVSILAGCVGAGVWWYMEGTHIATEWFLKNLPLTNGDDGLSNSHNGLDGVNHSNQQQFPNQQDPFDTQSPSPFSTSGSRR